MIENYLPVLIFIAIATVFGAAIMFLGLARIGLGEHVKNSAKEAPYECGFEAFEDARMQFDVRYYLVAILFIIFDLEIAFLFPWAVSIREVGLIGFVSMAIFLIILTIGFIYEWKKGALDWD